MDMFGGLKRASNRITIATALGLTLVVGFAMHASPAKAADLGGDCCADLEQRVAELEATTVRKGNKKVSVTISGWMIKALNIWDDGDLSNVNVGDKDYDLASRFAISGEAQIAPGWSAGYNATITVPGADTFGFSANQFDQLGGLNADINTLYSYMYIKSDKYGTVNWGLLSPASDNKVVLADISGSVIESNAVYFEGAGFFLRPSGAKGLGGLSGLTWGNFLQCYGLGGAGIGADCNGAAYDGVRYDSPTFGGFSIQASWGNGFGTGGNGNVGDVAVMYNGTWGNFKTSLAYTYTNTSPSAYAGAFGGANVGDNLNQVGGTLMHVPSGLGIYAEYINQQLTNFTGPGKNSDVWYIKPFIHKAWMPIGATTFYGEYGEYHDMMATLSGTDLCTVGLQTGGSSACGDNPSGVFATGSTNKRWGLGVVQDIDSAALSLFARWQHQDLDLDLVNGAGAGVHQGFDDLDVYQVGGIIFF